MANTFKGVVKLSQTQYETLKSTGTLTVGDVTITYDPTTTLYVTPTSGGSGGGLATSSGSSDGNSSVTLTNENGDYSFVDIVKSSAGEFSNGIWSNIPDTISSSERVLGIGRFSTDLDQTIKFSDNGLTIINAKMENSGNMTGTGIVVGNSSDGLQLMGIDAPFLFQTNSTITLVGSKLTFNDKNVAVEDSLPTSIDISGGV